MSGRTLTGVTGYFDSSHLDPFPVSGRGRPVHGHTWHVTAWWEGSPRRDARCLKETLRQVLLGFDHRLLDDFLSDTTAEGIAEALGDLMTDCIAVDVRREGYAARWER